MLKLTSLAFCYQSNTVLVFDCKHPEYAIPCVAVLRPAGAAVATVTIVPMTVPLFKVEVNALCPADEEVGNRLFFLQYASLPLSHTLILARRLQGTFPIYVNATVKRILQKAIR